MRTSDEVSENETTTKKRKKKKKNASSNHLVPHFRLPRADHLHPVGRCTRNETTPESTKKTKKKNMKIKKEEKNKGIDEDEERSDE